ncbi:sulfite exporter TauE/SafE family protein [Cupriavidus sp.]|uniref:sulfite exporter TauE/SafE family protein n=1 Tax=Cupriavidus sp. TaxID=1873897 RepID=UPI0025BD72A1|nr:sulfite exporter TauE/SafE family protein [Cupriavidus sp.]MCA3182755.1 sulfite exporter TauE/SafE family protein [Cupriavidus sp.]MCA3192390.1 sulfite exporter TauE/SafE family protein [Cupriavidus sp.]MCA3196165.1 sulfite exporter TauE/SafE family protein [Cupriavidus sp.]MCA3203698.1 sulfite exporter TauE/SafE family protein [Cupriavidus sp.]MCA3210282.1 sulfite exporter TauE/SafE family protein [Cupriavidus sp.]
MDSVWIVVALGAIVAGFVQGLSGFAFGMVAMSFWAWGVEPRMASAMSVFGALTGQLLAAFTVRRKFHLATVLPFLLGGIVGIPIGVSLLPKLDVNLFKLCLGTILVIWCPIMLFSARIPPIRHGGRVADAIVGAIGGIMGGIGGFTGIAPTLWCTLRGFDKDKQRVVIQNFNLGALTVTMAVYIGTGIITRDMLPMFAIVAPAMLIPTLLGTRVYIGISDVTFRRIVLTLLTCSGVAMLAASVPRVFG